MWGEHSYKQGCPGPPREGPGDTGVRGAHTSAGDAGGTFWAEDTGTQGVVRLRKAGCPSGGVVDRAFSSVWTPPSQCPPRRSSDCRFVGSSGSGVIQEQECLLGPWGHLRLEAAYLGSPTTLALVPLLPRGPPFCPRWPPLHWVLSPLCPHPVLNCLHPWS